MKQARALSHSLSGIFLVDKPAGVTSAQVVATIKKRFNFKKVGHAGTLDPLATGLLIILVNGATRFASFAEASRKSYSGLIRLGLRTSTDDIEGEVLHSDSEFVIDKSQISALSEKFHGSISQVPPKVSALKVDGERAYRKVRRNELFELKARQVTIYDAHFDLQQEQRISFFISCSKGTYIRAIARDIGELLGCGGCLEVLRREFSAPFSIPMAKPISQLELSDLICWTRLFPGATQLELQGPRALQAVNGDARMLESLRPELGERVILSHDGQPFGLLVRKEGALSYGGILNNPIAERGGELVCQH